MTPAPLIGLTGRAGVGKDTVAAELHRLAGFERVAFADALKLAAYDTDPAIEVGPASRVRLAALVDAHGWDYCKTTISDVRRYLQRFGVAMRDAMPGVWVDIARCRIFGLRTTGAPVVVTDVRFPDEVAAIKEAGGLVVRLTRQAARGLGVNAGHVSEQTDALNVDAEVGNDGPAYETAWTVLRLVKS